MSDQEEKENSKAKKKSAKKKVAQKKVSKKKVAGKMGSEKKEMGKQPTQKKASKKVGKKSTQEAAPKTSGVFGEQIRGEGVEPQEVEQQEVEHQGVEQTSHHDASSEASEHKAPSEMSKKTPDQPDSETAKGPRPEWVQRLAEGRSGALDKDQLDAVLAWISGRDEARDQDVCLAKLLSHLGVAQASAPLTQTIFAQLDTLLFVRGTLDLEAAHVDANTDRDARKIRYRRLMNAFHPDRFSEAQAPFLTERSQAIVAAYQRFKKGDDETAGSLAAYVSGDVTSQAAYGTGDLTSGMGRASARLSPLSHPVARQWLDVLRGQLNQVEDLHIKAPIALGAVLLLPLGLLALCSSPNLPEPVGFVAEDQSRGSDVLNGASTNGGGDWAPPPSATEITRSQALLAEQEAEARRRIAQIRAEAAATQEEVSDLSTTRFDPNPQAVPQALLQDPRPLGTRRANTREERAVSQAPVQTRPAQDGPAVAAGASIAKTTTTVSNNFRATTPPAASAVTATKPSVRPTAPAPVQAIETMEDKIVADGMAESEIAQSEIAQIAQTETVPVPEAVLDGSEPITQARVEAPAITQVKVEPASPQTPSVAQPQQPVTERGLLPESEVASDRSSVSEPWVVPVVEAEEEIAPTQAQSTQSQSTHAPPPQAHHTRTMDLDKCLESLRNRPICEGTGHEVRLAVPCLSLPACLLCRRLLLLAAGAPACPRWKMPCLTTHVHNNHPQTAPRWQPWPWPAPPPARSGVGAGAAPHGAGDRPAAPLGRRRR